MKTFSKDYRQRIENILFGNTNLVSLYKEYSFGSLWPSFSPSNSLSANGSDICIALVSVCRRRRRRGSCIVYVVGVLPLNGKPGVSAFLASHKRPIVDFQFLSLPLSFSISLSLFASFSPSLSPSFSLPFCFFHCHSFAQPLVSQKREWKCLLDIRQKIEEWRERETAKDRDRESWNVLLPFTILSGGGGGGDTSKNCSILSQKAILES